jgi:DNA binding domain, excisionase family
MLNSYPEILTVPQLAQALEIGLNTAYMLVRSEKIQSVRVGRQIRISKAALLKFLDSED